MLMSHWGTLADGNRGEMASSWLDNVLGLVGAVDSEITGSGGWLCSGTRPGGGIATNSCNAMFSGRGTGSLSIRNLNNTRLNWNGSMQKLEAKKDMDINIENQSKQG